MAANKTLPTSVNVLDYINSVKEEKKRIDAIKLMTMMESISGQKAVMWGPSIIGFGTFHYKYASGHEGDVPMIGFSPRSNAHVIYLETAFEGRDDLLSILGKFKTSKACIYIKSLNDIDEKVLIKMIKLSLKHTKKLHK